MVFVFFFQAEDGIRDADVTGVQTCALPILIESIAGDFDPEEFRNEYREDLRQMLEAKLAGQEIARPEPIPETPVIDLMEALKQSVAETKPPARKAAASSKPKRRRAPARKSA